MVFAKYKCKRPWYLCVHLVTQSCLTFCNPMDWSLLGSSVHLDSPGKNTEVGCHALLQGIFLTQELNLGLLHYRWILYQLSYQGIWKDCGVDSLEWKADLLFIVSFLLFFFFFLLLEILFKKLTIYKIPKRKQMKPKRSRFYSTKIHLFVLRITWR